MWIRSQDKQILGDFKCIKIQRSLRKYDICANSLSDTLLLGEYENLDIAINILNTIQKLIENDYDSIFEMPN